jgi:cobalt-zinc-cadmium resistance protein CzcA
MAALNYSLHERMVSKKVLLAYYDIVYHNNLIKEYTFLDSLYKQFSRAAIKRFKVGETNKLEQLTALSKQKEIAISLAQTRKTSQKPIRYCRSGCRPIQ